MEAAMRSAIVLAALMLSGTADASGADCDFDLAAVRAAALAAGPVRSVEHFVANDGANGVGRSLTIVIDLVRPDRMRRISIFEDGKVGHMVLIAGSGWSGSIDGKWETLDASFSAKMLDAVMKNSPWPASEATASCSPQPGADGQATLKFTFSTVEGEAMTTHEVVADRQTRMPLRYHALRSMKGRPYTETDRTFRFIGGLEIEAP
jgi:hypothetical protein